MSTTPTLAELPASVRAELERFHFNADAFETLAKRLGRGGDAAEANRIMGELRPPAASDIPALPPPGSEARLSLEADGEAAIAAGKAGVVILAGGMATRFGGVVKATVEAVDGHTFLDLKLRDVAAAAKRAGGRVPAFVMTSFATDAEVQRAVEAEDHGVPTQTFTQSVALRLAPDGGLFRDADGQPSLYAPGHGDLPEALRRSGQLDAFTEAGGEVLLMSNVDNLGATLDAAIIGAHLRARRAHISRITCEVVQKEPGDRGGAPAYVDGQLQVVEAFRFPADFDQDQVPVFNTNTFVFDTRVLGEETPLTYFAVHKRVLGAEAVQFERLVGQLTAFHPTHYLKVPRSGPDGRFQPVKDPAELAARQPAIRALLTARGVL